MLLTKKELGNIKGRMIANGQKQWLYVNKTKTASPTMYLESMMIISTIDAHEERNVAVTNIHGDFLSSYTDKDVCFFVLWSNGGTDC